MSDQPESRTQKESGGTQPIHSTDSKLEEAKRCPRCAQTGEEVAVHKNRPRPGCKVLTYECMNELCITKHERWIIQVNENGSIPERQAGPKEFEPASDRAMGIGKEIVERTRHQLDGGELRPGER